MSDPVREALLDATTEAETWQRDAAGQRRMCPADAMERMTAAAVAAFLRALQGDGLGSINTGQIGPMFLVELAAAVERAAREAGE